MKFRCSIDEIQHLSSKQVKEIMESDRKGDYILIDVRQPEEYNVEHIPGARLIPLGELETRAIGLERNKNLITYCRSGHRSLGAAILLCGIGFNKVYSIDGGMLAWDFEKLTGLPEELPNVIKGNESLIEILIIALKAEKGSLDFYNRMQDKVSSENAKNKIIKLAEVEENHLEILYNKYANMVGGDKLQPFPEFKQTLRTEYIEGGIEINKALLKIDDRDFKDELEVWEFALEKEYLAYDFYKRSVGLVADPDVKTVLNGLAMDERYHINSILNVIAKQVRGGSEE
jgi:rhodanese-related sulfurtransferase/rubrerythrin